MTAGAADLAARIAAVRERIARAATAAGRDPGAIALVAVSKTRPVEDVAAAAAAGIADVGENYAQEMAAKQAAVAAPLRWHFIGQLQRNKVKLVVGRAALIHAVDSRPLLEAIARRAGDAGLVQPILFAVSAAGEQQKSGAARDEVAGLIAAALAHASLRVDGLMTMPPAADDPEASRPHFRALRQLRDELATPAAPLPVLSMGMSADFGVAIEEGSTLVRVGTALFGPRTPL